MLLFILYKLGQLLACYLPSQLAFWIAERTADFFFIFPIGKYRKYKEIVFHNLGLINRDNTLYARRVFRNFARYIREFLWLGKISKEIFFRRAIPVGVENLDAALKIGRGVLLLSSHFGNWEWGGISLALCGYRMCFLVRPHNNFSTSELFNRLRRKKGIRVISIRHLKEAIKALKNNEIVAFLIDEGNTGIKVNLFDKKITLASGPFKIAYKTGAVVAPAFMIREEKTGRQKGIVEPPIILENDIKMEESIQKAAQKFARIMEDYLQFYPDHWLLLERKDYFPNEIEDGR